MITQYYEYFNAIKILSGNQALANISPELIKREKCSPLIICQKELIDRGILKTLIRAIKNTGIEPKKVFQYNKEADEACTAKALYEFESNNCDSVIAVGDSDVFELGSKIKSSRDQKEQCLAKTTFIAIPTAGTGMEILGDPDLIVLDPGMAFSFSIRETVLSAVDTICHGIETYTSSKKNPVSDVYAFSAIKLVAESIPAIIKKCGDRKARHTLSNGAVLSGMGFSNSGGGITHVIAKGLTQCCKVSHTEAVSIILPRCLEHNMIQNDQYYGELLLPLKGPEVYSETPLYERGRSFHNCIRNMISEYQSKWNIPVCLSQVGVKRSDFDTIVTHSIKNANTDKNTCDIPQVDIKDIIDILNLAF